MSDDEDGRLLIDDANDISGNDLIRAKSPLTSSSSSNPLSTKLNNISVNHKDNTNSDGMTVEDGEICEEDSIIPEGNGSSSEKVDDKVSRKRDGSATKFTDAKQLNGPESKRLKTNSTAEAIERKSVGTCVTTKAIQNDFEESPFDLEPGSSFTVQMTVVCKIERSNTLYITAKWKDQELSGVLTDGEPPFGSFNKKSTNRSNGSSSSTISSESGEKTEKTNLGTPSKKRIGRGVQTMERKKTPAKPQVDEDEDELDVGGTNDLRSVGVSAGSVALVEAQDIEEMHVCPTEGCFFRFSKGVEMDYHINNVHRKRMIMHEDICSQTDVSSFNEYKTVATETDCDLGVTLDQKDNIEKLIKSGAPTLTIQDHKLERQSPFSEISDDAPQLEKEEPPPKLETPQPVSNPAPAEPVPAPVGTPIGQSPICPVITSSSSSFQPVAGPSVSAAPEPTSRFSTPNGSSQNSLRASAGSVPSNGVFVPTGFTPTLMPGAFATPLSSRGNVNSPAREHKIHQLKASDVPADPATPSISRPAASPAQTQQRGFGLPMTPVSSAQQQHQMMQHQQQQYMHQMQQQHVVQAMMMQQAMMQGRIPQMPITPQDQQYMAAAMAAVGAAGPNFQAMFPK